MRSKENVIYLTADQLKEQAASRVRELSSYRLEKRRNMRLKMPHSCVQMPP